MVKSGNNPIPNPHFHKHWNPCASQRGHIRTHFKQGPQKLRRRQKRLEKAARIFPRPVSGKLRPLVKCPTQRHNIRTRLGKGFTRDELKAAGLHPKYALSIGISYDHRRRNHSEESLELNSNRLKAYLAKLVLWPKNPAKLRGRDSSKEERDAAVQLKNKQPVGPGPKSSKAKKEAPRKLTDEEKSRHIYQFLRKVQRDQKLVGLRMKRDRKKEQAKEEAAKLAKK
eukprot:TRINITY_DN10112_c0_g1_i1.p1 TRINITY_DN10112_c0_g1~~TRINITY_DN10112_c0_g1_i1.p1  ORF type:complete len:226 (+),score=31.39 TRINITY_DN10112_c0_g1_i1:71-748(+)